MANIQLKELTLAQIYSAPASKRDAILRTAQALGDLYVQIPGLAAVLSQRVYVDDATGALTYLPEVGDLEVNIGALLPEMA